MHHVNLLQYDYISETFSKMSKLQHTTKTQSNNNLCF